MNPITSSRQWYGRTPGGRLHLEIECSVCGHSWGYNDPPMPMIGARCPKCGSFNNLHFPLTGVKKEQGTMVAKKTSGGAVTFVLPVEKECGGSIKYGDKAGRDTLPASNIYITRKTWTNMPKKVKVTIEPAD